MPTNGYNICRKRLRLPEGCLKLAKACAQNAKYEGENDKQNTHQGIAGRYVLEVSGNDLRARTPWDTSWDTSTGWLESECEGVPPNIYVSSASPQTLRQNRGCNLLGGPELLKMAELEG